MRLSPDDTEFLTRMVRQLEESIGQLGERDGQLRLTLHPDRVEQLRELWDGELSRAEEIELRAGLDWRERELLWVWARLKRARSARAEAGQAMMRRFAPEGSA
ncbi:hypothetical protein [Methylomagnum ishizawai]|uniref:Uncharacterized protein n=1 Tax=Methylomagnum ishizawai TaxID=1760988 RepID=A0A1Y6D392_9GAMM|nr:hypothetical protein [Methylomagnum ishizawai]BBL76889.1 hypothetical protein MishRS11D_39870 [Methylomagnum ishizawai]SMF97117.1 hypothetical protein SAMN02949497_4536 [Methylomagnum ishizawai]